MARLPIEETGVVPFLWRGSDRDVTAEGKHVPNLLEHGTHLDQNWCQCYFEQVCEVALLRCRPQIAAPISAVDPRAH